MPIQEKLEEVRKAIDTVIQKWRYEVATEENCKKIKKELKAALDPIVPGLKIKAFLDIDRFKIHLTDEEKSYEVTVDNEPIEE